MNNNIAIKKAWTRIATVVLAFAVAFCSVPFVFGQSFAATKPGKINWKKPTAKGKVVTISWKKASNAKKYVVQKGSVTKWNYVKTVKKTAANKEKYSRKAYKVEASGSKYKVYKASVKYKKLATTKKLSYKYKGKYNTKYFFRVYAVNGSAKGPGVKFYIKTPKKPEAPEKEEKEEEPEWVEYPQYNVKVTRNLDDTFIEFKSAATSKTKKKVSIKASGSEHYAFEKWEVVSPSTLVIDDPTAAETTFSMPEEDVVIKACYKIIRPE